MADLTPELLEQLEKDVAGYQGTFDVEPSCRDNYADGEMSLTYLGDGDDVPVIIATELQGAHIAEPIARMLNAIPALVAAAKERDQLRAQLKNATALRQRDREHASQVAAALGIDGWENGWPDVAPRIEHMRAERDRAKQEIADIRVALDAHGHDGTFEAAAKLRDEAVKLRAEVERLRSSMETMAHTAPPIVAREIRRRLDASKGEEL